MRHGDPVFARPFLKWAGGKSQLLQEFDRFLPHAAFRDGTISRYVEPFIGGGAVFFFLNRKVSFDECTISDVNEELVLAYRVIRTSPVALKETLSGIEGHYRNLAGSEQEAFYYEVRDEFNREKKTFDFSRYNSRWVERAAQILFLNRTCYNGLFRVNSRGEFNVPFGRYTNPEILNKANIGRVASCLEHSRILCGDFSRCRRWVDDRTFVYLDPPYRPINPTSSFTSYSRSGFSESDQVRLAKFFRDLDRKGARVMLSNSDPLNGDPTDSFFDELYDGFSIRRVPAKRMINCNGSRRGKVTEILVTNYQ